MSTELSDIIGIFDSREKNQKRINAFTSFIEQHGGTTERGTLQLCDYSLEGTYKGKVVHLGIEAKSLSDFASSYQDLPDKLGRAYELYDEVGLFVEVGSYSYSRDVEGFHATIINQEVRDGSANVLLVSVLMNSLASWQHEGIHVRQLIAPEQFPDALVSVLVTITKENHNGLNPVAKKSATPDEINKWRFVNSNIHLGVDGMGVKTALKLRDYLISWNYPPNLHFATSLSEEDLQEAVGKKTGSALYQAYRCRDGWAEFKGHSEPIKSPPLNEQVQSKVNIPETVKSPLICPHANEANRNECKTKDNFKNQSDNNPEYTYLHEVTPFIEVPKGKFQNGGELFDVIDEQEPQSQSSSTDSHQDATLAGSSQDVKQSRNNTKLGTHDNLQSPSRGDSKEPLSFTPSAPDTLQSQGGFDKSFSSCDTSGESLLQSPLPPQTPGVTSSHLHEIKARQTINSLEDAIVDRVYEKPVESTILMREFATRGHTIPEVHEILLNSKKLHKYKDGGVVMVAYSGVKAEKEMDVGVP